MQSSILIIGLMVTALSAYVFRKQISDFIASLQAEAQPPKPDPIPKPDPAPIPEPKPEPEPAPVPPPAEDKDFPFVEITSPQTGASLDPLKPILITGKASDKQGMYKVEGRLVEPLPSVKGTLWKIATPKAPGDWSSWSLQIPPEGDNLKRIAVKATDRATNETFKSVLITYAGSGTIPGTAIPYPTANTVYTTSPVYPVTVKSPPNHIRQAMIDSKYFALIRNKVDIGDMTVATFNSFFIDPVKWLGTHPWVYTSYPNFFKEVAV